MCDALLSWSSSCYRQRPDKGIEVFRFICHYNNLIIALEASGTAREFDPLIVIATATHVEYQRL
jgi:hypothetical protein